MRGIFRLKKCRKCPMHTIYKNVKGIPEDYCVPVPWFFFSIPCVKRSIKECEEVRDDYEEHKRGMTKFTEREMKLKIEECAEQIAESLCKGKDIEIRKSTNGISVAEISKKVVRR